MGGLIISLIFAFILGIVWAALCYFCGFESFRENFWIAAITYFVGEWIITGLVALGKREERSRW